MDLRWWTFIHLVGVFGFLLSHGVSVSVALLLRKERDRERIRWMLQLSGSSIKGLYGSLALLVAGGFGGAFELKVWGQRWIRLSLGVLVVLVVVMLALARPYYRKVKEALAPRASGMPRISDEELAARLASPIPVAIAVIGGAGLLAILWMMVWKPI